MPKQTPAPRFSAHDFEALSEAQKQEFIAEVRAAPSRPLTPAERKEWKQFMERTQPAAASSAKRKGGRPKFGKHGVKVIALSVERDLLKRADAYAKEQGLKRAELFTQAIQRILPKAG